MLEVSDLCKSFGAIQVTNHVTLSVAAGERRVILGPNGAGKTTLFNLLAGALKPTAGSIHFDGQDISHLSVDARARAGIARSFQKNTLFEPLTVRENLALSAATKQRRNRSIWRDTLRHPQVRDVVERVAHQVVLQDVLDRDVSSLSYGERRQLEVGIALAAEPKLLLLDEPTSGVSPGATRAFHRLVAALPRDITLIIIEHDMDLAFDIADRVTVLNFGEVVFEGTPQETRDSQLVREIYIGEMLDDETVAA